MSKRQYIITHHRGDSRQAAFAVSYESPEDAVNSLVTALNGAGHDERTVAMRIKTLAAVLLGGGTDVTFLDPDLAGWVSLRTK